MHLTEDSVNGYFIGKSTKEALFGDRLGEVKIKLVDGTDWWIGKVDGQYVVSKQKLNLYKCEECDPPCGVWLWSSNGLVIFCTEKFEEEMGVLLQPGEERNVSVNQY